MEKTTNPPQDDPFHFWIFLTLGVYPHVEPNVTSLVLTSSVLSDPAEQGSSIFNMTPLHMLEDSFHGS